MSAGVAPRTLVVCGALVVGILVIYAPVRHFEFVSFDDPQYVMDNPTVASGLTAHGVVWAFGASHAANWHPLTWLSHMLDVELFGLDAGAHHLTNVFLHAVNSLLVFALFGVMTGQPWHSAFVAMVFALHPLRVESVAWVSERKDVLGACFWMLTVLAYVRWTRRPGPARYAAVLALFALGLMAKPMLVTLPAVLLLLDYWPLGRLSPRALGARTAEKLPLVVLAGLAAAATVYAQRAGGAMVALDRIPLAARLANASISYVRYIGATVYPVHLAIFYPYRPWPAWMALAATGALVAVSAAAVRLSRRCPYLLFGWLWYVVTLTPVIGVVQVGSQAMADRFTYVPQIGLSVILAWGAGEVLRGWRHRDVALGAAALAIGVVCVVVSARQTRYWRSTEALFDRALAVTRDNYLAQLSLGAALVDQGRLDEARAHYFEGLRLNPGSAIAQVNVGNVLAREGRPDEAEGHYREALRLKPEMVEAHNSLGLLLARAGKMDEAIAHFRDARTTNPDYPESRVNLGNALRALGRFDEAAAEYRAVLRRRPDWADARYGLAVSLGSLGDLAGAEREYREAARLDPALAEAQFGLGIVLQGRGMTREAIAALREAVRRDPGLSVAAEALAWLLATSDGGDPADAAEAVRLAETARTAEGHDSPRLLDTLAAAYATAGRFAEAAATARQAAALARAGGDDRFAGDVEKRLALYESARPVRSSARETPR